MHMSSKTIRIHVRLCAPTFHSPAVPSRFTVVVWSPLPSSRYPFVVCTFPGLIGDQQLAGVCYIPANGRRRGCARAVGQHRRRRMVQPLASFQLESDHSGNLHCVPIATSEPAKSILIGFPDPPAARCHHRITVAISDPSVPVPVIVSVYVPTGVLVPMVTFSVGLSPLSPMQDWTSPSLPSAIPSLPNWSCRSSRPVAIVFAIYGCFHLDSPSAYPVCRQREVRRHNRVTFAVCVSDPLVPVIVSVYVPCGMLVPAVMLSAGLLPALADTGLNVPVAPSATP